MIADEITLKDLEFHIIIEKLKGYAQTTTAKEHLGNPEFLSSKEDIEKEYDYVTEAISIIGNNEDISLEPITDIRGHIARLRKGGIIGGTDILSIKDMIALIRQFRSFIRAKREEYPSIYRLTECFERYDELFSSINRIIDEKGIIRDDCSERLSDFRKEVKKIREKIIEIIDKFFYEPDLQKILMDSYYSIRNNRYVLPVKTQFKGNVKGIIHGSSSTGETLFIEPEPIVTLDNELVYAESRVAGEEENILRELCSKINEYSDNLSRDYDILIKLDIIFARAKYSIRINGVRLKVKERFNIIDIRHPVLVLKDLDVIPNNIYLEDGVKGIIISGPNAGGKTVLLKSIGLALLHMKIGLFFPVYEKSSMLPFNNIFTCFGDAQNLEQGLSTFTGHIKRLKYILENCSRNDLILLDEIASDTDPREGSALSASIIDSMIKKGAYVFVTTHFHELRHWASNRNDIINAAMSFDPVKLKPTYKLVLGISGESYTLRIAKEMGLSDEIIENANAVLGDDYREYLEISNLLKTREKELSEKIASLEKQQSDYEKEFIRLVQEKETEYQKRFEEFEKKRDKIISELEIFYNKVSAEISRIQKGSDMKSAVSLQKEVKEFIRNNNDNKDIKIDNRASEFAIGDFVFVERLKSSGIVIEYDLKKKRYLVNVNNKNIWLDVYDLIKSNVKQVDSLKVENISEDNKYHGNTVEYQKEIDVRGLYLDDALSEIEKELDNAYRNSCTRLKIIHGHGTGSLKIGIRKYLRQSMYVSAFRPAEMNDGGDGVTIVEIKND